MKTNRIAIKDLTISALMLALMTLGAYIKIPVPFSLVPFTLQLLIVFICGFSLKKYQGAMILLLYCLLGLIGLPLFTQGGGLHYLTKISFGYIIGFIFTSFVISHIIKSYDKPSFKHYVLAGIIGWIVLYVVALSYAAILYKFVWQMPIQINNFLFSLFIVFLPNDALALFLAIKVSQQVKISK